MTASKQSYEVEMTNLLKDILAVQLLEVGVPQKEVREIVRCSTERVSTIGKALNKSRTGSARK